METKTLKLSGTKTIDQISLDFDLTGALWLVNGNNEIAQAIKIFQNRNEELKDTYLQMPDGTILPDKIADFNHIGLIVQAMFQMEFKWKKLLFKKIPTYSFVDDTKMNCMIYEETQLPGCSIEAANIFTDILYYKQRLQEGHCKNFIIGIPKFPKYNNDIVEYTKDTCGSVPYNYKNLTAFIKSLKTGEWKGDTTDDNLTCSEEIAHLLSTLLDEWQDKGTYNYVELLDFFKEFYKIAPIHFFLTEWFDFYLIEG